jgi:hypothetical protein
MLCEKAVAMVQKPKKKDAVDDDFLTSQPVGERAGENRPSARPISAALITRPSWWLLTPIPALASGR